MTQEDKQLSLKPICGYLPYGLIYHRNDGANIKLEEIDVVRRLFNYTDCPEERDIKPYLRPMSSMTEEERKELSKILNYEFYIDDDFALAAEDDRHRIRLDLLEGCIDWLLAHHFDYRGLIEKELALEAPEGMYNKEESEEESEIPIPKNVDEAVKTLAKILSKEDRDYLLENGSISMHDSLGRWIRNEWGLWTGSELKDELMNMNKGLNHPDDMSNYIIEEFIKYWNNKL